MREDARAGDLSVEARQLVEIARALSYGARFIILDEPTAQLDGDEIKRLFRRISELQREGVTFLFISHHLQEVYEICQAVTVLRDARHIVSAPVSALPREQLIEAMTGERGGLAVADAASRDALPADTNRAGSRRSGGCRLRRGVVHREARRSVGLTGATSSGRTSVAEAIAGLRAAKHGAISVEGATLPHGRRARRIGARHRLRAEGSASRRPGADAIGCRKRVDDDRAAARQIRHRATGEEKRLRPEDDRRARHRRAGPRACRVRAIGRQPAEGRDGARARRPIPNVLVLIDPTAGVDVKSKEALLSVVDRVREDGKAVLVVSGELDDLRTCDRVLVMFRGRVAAEFPAGWQDHDLIASVEGVSLHEE